MNKEVLANVAPRLAELVDPIIINVPMIVLAGISMGVSTFVLGTIGERQKRREEANKPVEAPQQID